MVLIVQVLIFIAVASYECQEAMEEADAALAEVANSFADSTGWFFQAFVSFSCLLNSLEQAVVRSPPPGICHLH